MPTFLYFSLTETLLIDSRSHSDYKFLQNSLDYANGIDDQELWQETEDAANVLGFTDEQRIAMYKTCAGILHWGNGKFKQRPREEQAEVADSECKIMNYRFVVAFSPRLNHVNIFRKWRAITAIAVTCCCCLYFHIICEHEFNLKHIKFDWKLSLTLASF